MADKAEHRHRFKVKIDGRPLSGEVESRTIMAMVEDTRNAPDLCVLSFLDPDRKGPNSVLDKTGAKIGCPVEISVVSGDETSGQLLFKGEVTAIETEVDSSGWHTVIRGFDQSHRLFRGTKTRIWTNKSYSDIASAIASELAKEANASNPSQKLTVGQIDATSPVFEHVPQFNMSDWDFLKWMAAESNREMSVGEGKFEFRKSTDAKSGQPVPEPRRLEIKDLFRFHAMVSAADQVKEVVVRGFDYLADKVENQAVMGKAEALATSAKVGTSPGEIAGKVGNRVLVEVNSPSGNPAHLQNVADSIAEQIGAAHAEIEFEATGNHELRAGTTVSFSGAGKLFDGTGVITTSRHVDEPNRGYRTFGYVTGRQDRSLLALAGGTNGQGAAAGPLGARRIDGVVPAVVENNKDDKELGRVKLRFPWLDGKDGKYVSDWARVVQPGAGKDRGWFLLPEVGDQVIVAFEQGDIRHPIVIGGVYNEKTKWHGGKIKLLDASTKEVGKKGFRSRTGHYMAFVESSDQSGVAIASSDTKQSIHLNQTKGQVFIKAAHAVIESSTLTITVDSTIDIKADGSIKLEAAGPLTLKGATVNIN